MTASLTWTDVSLAFPVPSARSVIDFNMEMILIYKHSYYICKFHTAAIRMFPDNTTFITVYRVREYRIQSLAFRQIHLRSVQKVSIKFYQQLHL